MRLLLSLLVTLLLAGCVAAPTQEEISHADYGNPVTQEAAVHAVKQYFLGRLKDPESAQYRFGTVAQNYWIGSVFEGRKLTAGYSIKVDVNAKNSYGGYVGFKSYTFLVHNNKVINGYEMADIKSGLDVPLF